MGMNPGTLDRRISILRGADQDDGMATIAGPAVEIGQRWANKTDVSDGERMRASQNGQDLTTRFIVRFDSLTRTITGKDFVACEGTTYAVVGTKEVGDRREAIEITANAQPDTAA